MILDVGYRVALLRRTEVQVTVTGSHCPNSAKGLTHIDTICKDYGEVLVTQSGRLQPQNDAANCNAFCSLGTVIAYIDKA